jgi:AbrB family looped-hinge helix DNA binding protein
LKFKRPEGVVLSTWDQHSRIKTSFVFCGTAVHGRYTATPTPKKNAMSQAITIDRAGRIVLPAELRRRLNLGPGSRLRLDVVAQHIELTPETEPVTGLAMSASRRTVLQPTGEPFDAAAAMRAEREAQARRGERG